MTYVTLSNSDKTSLAPLFFQNLLVRLDVCKNINKLTYKTVQMQHFEEMEKSIPKRAAAETVILSSYARGRHKNIFF